MTLYGPPPGRRCCCNCGADLGPDTDPPPPHRVIDACGWPLDFCEGCWDCEASGHAFGPWFPNIVQVVTMAPYESVVLRVVQRECARCGVIAQRDAPGEDHAPR